MQRLIDANKIDAYLGLEYEGKEITDIDTDIPTVLEIPDNATNGDMIKALFPKCPTYPLCHDIGFYADKTMQNMIVAFPKEWWNAPYKGGQDERDSN